MYYIMYMCLWIVRSPILSIYTVNYIHAIYLKLNKERVLSKEV